MMGAEVRIMPDWPRLLSEEQACAYVSIGKTLLREKGPKPKQIGRRVLYDRRDLDRWADALDLAADAGPIGPSRIKQRMAARGY